MSLVSVRLLYLRCYAGLAARCVVQESMPNSFGCASFPWASGAGSRPGRVGGMQVTCVRFVHRSKHLVSSSKDTNLRVCARALACASVRCAFGLVLVGSVLRAHFFGVLLPPTRRAHSAIPKRNLDRAGDLRCGTWTRSIAAKSSRLTAPR